MTLIVADRILETSTTTGTGALTLAGAVVGYVAASSVAANGDTLYGYIEAVDGDGLPTGDWETGLYTWGTGNTLTIVGSPAASSTGSKISWAAGTKRVGLGITATAFGSMATLLANTFVGAQRGTFVDLTDGATVAVDLSLSNQFNLVLGGNRTLGAPTNVVAGQQGLINVYQDTTGSRTLAYAWMYGWAGGTAGVLSTAGCTKDMLAYSVDYYSTGTFTTTIATPGVMTKTAHGFISGQKCQLSTTGALPTGLSAATTYYIHKINADTFHLCTSLANVAAGTYIATSGSQSGTHTITSGAVTLAISKATP